MARLFILVRRKGSKRFIGAIPAKPGATKAQLLKTLRNKVKKGMSIKIVSEMMAKKIIIKQRPRSRQKRRRK